MYFRKSNIGSHELDVQETNVSISQFKRGIRKKNLEKRNEWWQHRSQWWVWYRRLHIGLQHWIRVHLTAWEHSEHKVRVQTVLALGNQLQDRVLKCGIRMETWIPAMGHQLSDIQCWPSWESLFHMYERNWGLSRGRIAGHRRQCDCEGGSTSWTRYQENLRTTKNTDVEQVKTLFDISQKLISGSQKWDIRIYIYIYTYDWMEKQLHGWELFAAWQSDRAVESKGTRLFWFSAVLERFIIILSRFGTVKTKLDGSWILVTVATLNGTDGEPVEFEWNISQDTPYCNCSMRLKRRWSEDSEVESSSCRCTTTLIGQKMETQKTCISNSLEVRAYAHRFPQVIGHSSGQEQKKSDNGTHTYKPNGLWNQSAEMIMFNPENVDIVSFEQQVRWTEDHWKARKEGSCRFTATVTCRPRSCCFRTIISVSQLSVHGAISDWCEELDQQISDLSFSWTMKPVAKMNGQLDCRRSPEVLSILTKPFSINVSAQGNLRSHNEIFETHPH